MNVSKEIPKSLDQAFLLRYVILFPLILGAIVFPAYATQVFHYKTYHPETGKVTNRFYYSIAKGPSGEYQVHWVIDEDGAKTEEDYILNESLETLRFKVVNITEKTDYAGERKDNVIFINGEFKGERVSRSMAIDEHPFYYNPKLGLSAFVRSGKKDGKFWGFQNKELKVYPMKAINKGGDRVTVAGQEVDVVKVYWTVDDFRSAFFKRTYWFRESDGLYVKQESGKGLFRELISEQAE